MARKQKAVGDGDQVRAGEVVACVENNERFGIGVCDESAVVAGKAGVELRAAGRHGFIKVETDPVKLAPVGDRFIARGIRLSMFGAGDVVNLASGAQERRAGSAPAAKSAFERLLQDLMRDCGELGDAERSGRDPSARQPSNCASSARMICPPCSIWNAPAKSTTTIKA